MMTFPRHLSRKRLPLHIAASFNRVGWGALASLPGLTFAGPTGEDLVAGDAAVIRPDQFTTQIDQHSQSAVMNWQTFSIEGNEYVVFNQPGATASILNRVVGSDPSRLLGQMSANGRVFLVNPRGVYFGPGAQIDVGALQASILDIKNEDFMAGHYVFIRPENAPDGASVVNDGHLEAGESGFIVLAGDYVANSGVIEARLGTAVLAAGSRITLGLDQDGLVSFAVDEKVLSELAGVENLGEIAAQGGRVLMTAKVADGLVATAVNNEGLIEAHSVVEQNGQVFLRAAGGDVQQAGTIDVSGQNEAAGGRVVITSSDDIKVASGSRIDIGGSGAGDGGTARLVAEKNLDFQIGAEITGEAGEEGTKGGRVELSGHESLALRGQVTLGSDGELVLDPGRLEISAGNSPPTVNDSASVGKGYIEGQLNANTDVTLVASSSVVAVGGPFNIDAAGAGDLAIKIGSLSYGGSPSLGGGSDCGSFGVCTSGSSFSFNPGGFGNIDLTGININIGGRLTISAGTQDGSIKVGDVQTGGDVTLAAGSYDGFIMAGDVVAVGNVTMTAGTVASSEAGGGDILAGDISAGGLLRIHVGTGARGIVTTITAGNLTAGAAASVELIAGCVALCGGSGAAGVIDVGDITAGTEVNVTAGKFATGNGADNRIKITAGDINAGGGISLEAGESSAGSVSRVTAGTLVAGANGDVSIIAGNSGTGIINLGNVTGELIAIGAAYAGSDDVGEVTTLNLTATGAFVSVFAGGNNGDGFIHVGNVSAAENVTFVAPAGDVIAGNIAAGAGSNDVYILADEGITAGNVVAGDSIGLDASDGNVTAGNLTGRTVSILGDLGSDGGVVDVDAITAVEGVFIHVVGDVITGDITTGPDDAFPLGVNITASTLGAVTGNITVGNVVAQQSITLNATGGDVTAASLTVTGGNVSIEVSGFASSGAIDIAGGVAAMATGRAEILFSADNITIGGNVSASADGSSAVIWLLGNPSTGTVQVGGSVRALAGGLEGGGAFVGANAKNVDITADVFAQAATRSEIRINGSFVGGSGALSIGGDATAFGTSPGVFMEGFASTTVGGSVIAAGGSDAGNILTATGHAHVLLNRDFPGGDVDIAGDIIAKGAAANANGAAVTLLSQDDIRVVGDVLASAAQGSAEIDIFSADSAAGTITLGANVTAIGTEADISISAAGNIAITGDVLADGKTSEGSIEIFAFGTGNVTIGGDVTAKGSSAEISISGANVTVGGAMLASATNDFAEIDIESNFDGTVTLNGNVSAMGSSASIDIHGGTVSIAGDVLASASSEEANVSISAANDVTANAVTARTTGSSFASIFVEGADVTVGAVTAAGSSATVVALATGTLTVNGATTVDVTSNGGVFFNGATVDVNGAITISEESSDGGASGSCAFFGSGCDLLIQGNIVTLGGAVAVNAESGSILVAASGSVAVDGPVNVTATSFAVAAFNAPTINLNGAISVTEIGDGFAELLIGDFFMEGAGAMNVNIAGNLTVSGGGAGIVGVLAGGMVTITGTATAVGGVSEIFIEAGGPVQAGTGLLVADAVSVSAGGDINVRTQAGMLSFDGPEGINLTIDNSGFSGPTVVGGDFGGSYGSYGAAIEQLEEGDSVFGAVKATFGGDVTVFGDFFAQSLDVTLLAGSVSFEGLGSISTGTLPITPVDEFLFELMTQNGLSPPEHGPNMIIKAPGGIAFGALAFTGMDPYVKFLSDGHVSIGAVSGPDGADYLVVYSPIDPTLNISFENDFFEPGAGSIAYNNQDHVAIWPGTTIVFGEADPSSGALFDGGVTIGTQGPIDIGAKNFFVLTDGPVTGLENVISTGVVSTLSGGVVDEVFEIPVVDEFEEELEEEDEEDEDEIIDEVSGEGDEEEDITEEASSGQLECSA